MYLFYWYVSDIPPLEDMSDLVQKIQIIREQREKKSSQNKQKRPDQVSLYSQILVTSCTSLSNVTLIIILELS